MSASHTGSPWTRPISTDRLRSPTLSCFQPRSRWFSSSTFFLQSHAKSRHFPSSELYEQREFAGLVAEWSALTHSNSLIGRLPPATIGTWLNTAGAPGRGMSGPPIESLTRSKMTSLAWPIQGSRARIAAIPSCAVSFRRSWIVQEAAGKAGPADKDRFRDVGRDKCRAGPEPRIRPRRGAPESGTGSVFLTSHSVLLEPIVYSSGGVTGCISVLASATWRGRGRVCMATGHEPTAGRSRHCCQSRVESDSCSADGGQWLFSEYRSGPSGGR
ncbi:uncharacterized protein BDZ83DRAFT_305376 [Colletotrichum acutatum]|uniref:Uncharacterized protein n=1 Tax=Glomerella acutata TaxID=27357 RepID=A0AAD8URZ2_GLOAC|nr:uncharacterized protein BDZ83DRAFT_305376 [Colletotrichum acutatum]KAK1725335.1 hypothetical protein BDZ83DRAFT_305376 [Colletotrichum acutatum]